MGWFTTCLVLVAVVLQLTHGKIVHRYKRHDPAAASGCSIIQQSCCSANLMDTDGRAVVEYTRYSHMVNGKYAAVMMKFCFNATINGQLWTKVDETNYILYKQWPAELVVNDPRYVIYNFRDSSGAIEKIEISDNTRFGLHVQAGGRGKIPVPYNFSSLNTLYMSMKKKPTQQGFTVGDNYKFDDLQWPRAFSVDDSVVFCTEENCEDKRSIWSLPQGPAGPVGPPGPPGPCLSPDATDQGFTCDATQGVLDDLRTIKTESQGRDKKIDDILEQLKSGNPTTGGYCPIGFESGTFGLGKCYMVVRDRRPFGGAQFYCLDYGARLVSVESTKEHQFLTTLLARDKIQPSEVFWTSGMYSPGSFRWVWYNENTATKKDLSVAYWATGQPVTYSGSLNCLAMVLQSNNTVQWYAGECPLRSYFVCERAKECY